MKTTRQNPIAAVFSLRPNSDYSRFVPENGAEGMMRDTWLVIGTRLMKAANTVGREANGKKSPSTDAHT